MSYNDINQFEQSQYALPFIGDSRRPYSASHSATLDGRQRNHVRFHSSDAAPTNSRPTMGDALLGGMTDPQIYPSSQVQIQEQLRMYRQELAKKNQLISQLTSIDAQRPIGKTMPVNGGLTMPLDRSYSNEHLIIHEKLDSLQRQLREAQLQVDMRDERIRDLKQQLDASRDTEARQSAEIQQLRRHVAECDLSARGGGYGAGSTSRLEQKESYDRVRDLESRLRSFMEERERTEHERHSAERRLDDIVAQFCRLVFIDVGASGQTSVGLLEHVLHKTTEIVHENTSLRAKTAMLHGNLESAETEQKTNRETIVRMMNDHQNFSQFSLEMDNLRVERDAAVGRQKELLAEIDSLKDQLDSSRHAWSTMRRELEDLKQQRRSDVDRDNMAQATELQSRAFKECLAKMLSDGATIVEAYEEVIRERVQNLIIAVHEKDGQLDSHEGKLSKMASQLDAQYELNRVTDRKLKRAEADLVEMEDRLRRAECRLPAGDLAQLSHERCVRLLERISRALNMAPFLADASVDEMTNEVIVRAERLCQEEMQSDRKTLVIHLQRKVKKLKEKLIDKERHVEAIQRRLSALEDKMSCTSESESEKDEVYAKNRKLVSLVEKYRCELNEAHLEIRDLTSRLLVTSDAQLKVELKNQEIANLSVAMDQLEHVRHQQAGEIDTLTKSRSHLEEKKDEAAASASAMAEELNRVKFALNDLTRRQRELLEFRKVVGRMLGLNAGPLTAADFEIVARLEKLILANRASMASTIPVDASFEELARNYRQGYAGDGGGFGSTDLARSKEVTMSPEKKSEKKDKNSRSRSQSPVRKPDKKVY